MARKAAAQVDPKAEEPKTEEPLPTEDIEISLDEAAEPAEEAAVETTAPVAPEPAEPAPSDEDAKKVAALQQRLQEMERAEQLSRERDAERDRLLAEAQAKQRQTQYQANQDRYNAVVNTMGAAQSQIEAATQELEAAGNAGDWKLVAEVNRKISRAETELYQAEKLKEQWDNWFEQQKRQPQQPPRQPQPQPQRQQQQPLTTEQIIAGATIPDNAKDWLRAHPEYITDPAKNAKMIGEAYPVAKYLAGNEEFTPKFFEHFETILGIRQQQKSNGGGPDAPRPAPVQRQSAHVSAPPTREAPSMSTGRAPQPTQIKLNKEQQEIAYATRPKQDMTRQQANELYARNLLKMRKMKTDGEIE